MPSQTKSLFLLGTGYVGGSLLTRLLASRRDLTISALSRSDSQAATLISLGVKPIRGDLSDTELIRSTAASHDIVINLASADDVSSVQAILDGLTSRKDKTERKSVFIHTSGTGLLVDDSKSEYAAEAKTYTFHDSDPAELERRIRDKALHRNVDLIIRDQLASPEKEREHNASVAILSPPTIYGMGSGPFNRTSIQAPAFIRASIEAKQGLTVGKGRATWDAVHVEDLVDAFLLLLEHLEKTLPATEEGYYWFAGTHVFAWGDLSRSIGKALHAHGHAATSDVRQATPEELGKHFWGDMMAFVGFGSNALAASERLTRLGWKKRSDTLDILQSVEQVEVKAVFEALAAKRE